MSRRRRQRGQAAVETAITLPLTVFLFLGTLQLFLALQARVLSEYAVFRAVRVGSTNHARCRPMMDAAVLALIPSFKSFMGHRGMNAAASLADAFRQHGPTNGHHFDDEYGLGSAQARHLGGNIVLMERRFSRPVTPPDLNFDQPGPPTRLEVRMIYWYPMRIPFANWVISKMVLGSSSVDPILPAAGERTWAHTNLNGLRPRIAARAVAGELLLPLVTEASMRMMSPVQDVSATCGGS